MRDIKTRHDYWRANLAYLAVLLSIWFAVSFGCGILFVDQLNRVIVPRCNDASYATEIDKHMLYVASTRAMHELTLTHTDELSRFLRSAVEQSLFERPPH